MKTVVFRSFAGLVIAFLGVADAFFYWPYPELPRYSWERPPLSRRIIQWIEGDTAEYWPASPPDWVYEFAFTDPDGRFYQQFMAKGIDIVALAKLERERQK